MRMRLICINYVILVPKKSIRGRKCHFRSIFGSFTVKFLPNKKIRLWILGGGLSSYFWAIMLISAVTLIAPVYIGGYTNTWAVLGSVET